MKKPTIICVDDERFILTSLKQQLKHGFDNDFNIELTSSGEEAYDLLEELMGNEIEVPVIISDHIMPGIYGDELLIKIHKKYPTIIKILLTGQANADAVGNAVNNAGLYRYIPKPWEINDFLMTIKEAVHKYFIDQKIEHQNLTLREKNNELLELNMGFVLALEKANFYNDEVTGNHIKRVCQYSNILALAYGLPEEQCKKINVYASLHDIGKVGIPDKILKKPGKLTAEEFEKIKAHPKIGFEIINNSAISDVAKNIILSHHEKFNGDGYPQKLKGEKIPLEAKIVAIADVYDALRTERSYKKAFPKEKTEEIITDLSGSHFDPVIVDIFKENTQAFSTVHQEFSDT